MSRSAPLSRAAPFLIVLAALSLAGCPASGPLEKPIPAYVEYPGIGRPGAEYLGEGLGTRFVLYAPRADSVQVRGDFTGWAADPVAMAEAGGGWWTATVADAAPGQEYKYWSPDFGDGLASTDGDNWATDPYADAFSSDSQNAIVLDPTNAASPAAHSWVNTAWARPPRDELVIYELQVEDFADRHGEYLDPDNNLGAFDGVRAQIGYLQALGVNAVELMPIQEWTGEGYSWGYNTAAWSAPENSYGSSATDGSAVGDLKALVDALHGAGIAVILDVVYNHSNQDNPLWDIDAEIWFQVGVPDLWGPWLDFGSGAFAAFVRDNLEMWLDESRVDGFRFDATQFVDERVLIEIVDGLDAMYPGRYWIFEEFDGSHNARIQDYNDAAGSGVIASWGAGWKDTAWSALFGSYYRDLGDKTYHSNGFDGTEWKWPTSVINYHSSHDEGTIQGVGFTKTGTLGTAAEARLAATQLLTAMGIPMLWMGEEVGRVHYGNNTTNATDPANNSFDWNGYLAVPENVALRDYYAGLIALRKAHPNLRVAASDPALSGTWSWNMTSTAAQPNTWGSGALAWVSKGSGDNAFAVFLNFTGTDRAWTASFPADGDWLLVADSDPEGDGLVDAAGTGALGTLTVSGGIKEVTVGAGQALVYMSPEAMPAP
ncbi:MAG: hypothetical protein KBC36_10015 [Spirochaetia bacterium]|nr:hypothetical protein [Spirochaetia bacterium]